MTPQSSVDSSINISEEEVEMVELERENKRDRLNTSFESAKDDDEKSDGEKSPKMKKRKEVKMQKKDYTMIY